MSGWTIEECGCFQDDWGRPAGWAVIDEDGEQIEFFREREDAEGYLNAQQGSAEVRSEADLYEQEFTDPFTGETMNNVMPDLETLAYLENLKARLVAAQLLAAGSSAWGAIRRITLDLERTIAAAHAERDRWAEELMALESNYFAEEADALAD